jgi:hypothetical protein
VNTGWEDQREVCYYVWSSEGGITHLCQLRTNYLALVSKFDYILVHTRLMGPRKLSSFIGRQVG